VVDSTVFSPVPQPMIQRPAKPGYRWVWVDRQETYTEYVVEIDSCGRRLLRPVTRTRTVRELQEVPETSSNELEELRRQVAALQTALGLANIGAADIAQTQRDKIDIQKTILVTLTAAVTETDTELSVSSVASLPSGFYRIGSEIIEVLDAKGTKGTTVTVVRGRDGTTATKHAAGTVITPR